ncbi:chorismate-binding protein [Buchananella felis]|uniref:isochorismate synthase n=1 Tax=Buchananella felis TaxID=3231492 RepID=UPI00352885E9
MIAPAIPQLCARTFDVTGHPLLPTSLLGALPAADALAWVRTGVGFVGGGVTARLSARGPQRFAALDRQWRAVVALAQVDDAVGLPGTGLIAAGSFAFADSSECESFLLVPRFVLGFRDERWWFTHIFLADDAPPAAAITAASGAPAGGGGGAGSEGPGRAGSEGPGRAGAFTPGGAASPEGDAGELDALLAAFLETGAAPARQPGRVTTSPGAHPRSRWDGVVRQAIAQMETGRAQKVVLARDVYVHTEHALDPRVPLTALGRDYPGCWTFQVGSWLGATPELLVRLDRGLVAARVLAGTIRRTGDDEADLLRAGNLARSSKDLAEHEFAVDSVAHALGDFCTTLNVPEQPFVLHLPNVMHLATDVTGVLPAGTGVTSLALAGALHPSAAVGGTPKLAAQQIIAELEGMDRANYAGPVGWMDATGDGEWGIALRCGVIEPQPGDAAGRAGSTVRLFAGGGILPQSVPAAEVAETSAKLQPMLGALGATDAQDV